jgi:hypothetical protein
VTNPLGGIAGLLVLVLGAICAVPAMFMATADPGSGANLPPGAYGNTRLAFATAFAASIDADNEAAIQFVLAWETVEGARPSANNPLNSTHDAPGAVVLPGNRAGVKMYPSLDVGLRADVDTIQGGGRYEAVIAALRLGDDQAAAAALQASPWCDDPAGPNGHECPGYGAGILGLVASYGDPATYARAGAVPAGTTSITGAGGPRPVGVPGSLGPVLAFLQAQLGKPYQWGGAGPDAWDCSGLTMAAYAQVGIPLPHNAAAQYAMTRAAAVDASQLQPGDLVFFEGPQPGHVGVYIGNGQMIDAPHTGAFVRVEAIWRSSWTGATRPAALAGSRPAAA